MQIDARLIGTTLASVDRPADASLLKTLAIATLTFDVSKRSPRWMKLS